MRTIYDGSRVTVGIGHREIAVEWGYEAPEGFRKTGYKHLSF